jgi:hypothetical protein
MADLPTGKCLIKATLMKNIELNVYLEGLEKRIGID